jgi:hypothetical protein
MMRLTKYLGQVVLGLLVSASTVGLAGSAAAAANAPSAVPSVGASAAPLSFARDVVPAMTKAGCNMGACHGSFQGRGGLSLSLLGYDVVRDYDALFKYSRGRRVSTAAPDQSLLLLKGTNRVPHGGGARLAGDGEAYRIIRQYIAEGCAAPSAEEPIVTRLEVTPAEVVAKPGQKASLRVSAVWSDGVRRDITPWALFDSRDKNYAEVTTAGEITTLKSGRVPVTVRYAGQVAAVDVTIPYGEALPHEGFTAKNFIDEIVGGEWKKLGLKPVPTCDDGEFIRRVSVDLIGTLPTTEEVRAFLASNDPRKRSKLVDELLERPEYVDYWSLKWSDLLRVHRRYVGEKGLESFGGWVRRAVRENRPVDAMVRELLASQGSLYTSGPVAFYLVDKKPEELAETTAQVFLGIRLQCTKCHHHPMEVWGQEDYYGLAAFFTRLEIKDNKDGGRFGGAQLVKAVATPQKSRKLEMDAPPLFFDQELPLEGVADIRTTLAEAVTSPKQPYFARNFANRYWAYLMGRGLVEPIDDFRATNPPTIPALLDALAKEFVDHGHDPKHMLRLIANSSVYQRAGRINADDRGNAEFYTHRTPRRLPAEVLLDAVNRATGTGETFTGIPEGTRAIALPDPSVQSYFLDVFGRPARNSGCECARGSMPDLSQALHLANGTWLHEKIVRENGRVAKLLKAKKPQNEIVDELYLSTLNRLPTGEERAIVDDAIASAPTPAEGYQDLLWTLINCTEFQFNH